MGAHTAAQLVLSLKQHERYSFLLGCGTDVGVTLGEAEGSQLSMDAE